MKELQKMINGKLFKLRHWHDNDIEKLTEIRNNVHLQSKLLSRVRGSNFAKTKSWLQSRSETPSTLLLVIADKKTDTPLGYIQIVDIDPIDQTAKLGICLVHEAQGKNIGHEVLLLTLKYLYNNFLLRKITVEVAEDNNIAIKCYKKIGFIQCGKYLKHKYIDARWHNLIIMELFLADMVSAE